MEVKNYLEQLGARFDIPSNGYILRLKVGDLYIPIEAVSGGKFTSKKFVKPLTLEELKELIKEVENGAKL